jgi:hypothetical protein
LFKAILITIKNNRFTTTSLVTGDSNTTSSLLSNLINGRTTRSDNKTVLAGVRQDQESSERLLLSVLNSALNLSLGLLNLLGLSAEDPRVGALLTRSGVLDNLPEDLLITTVIGNQGHILSRRRLRVLRLRRTGDTVMVNGNLEVLLELHEETSISDGMVKTTGNLEKLSIGLLDHLGDVGLALLDGGGNSGNLDVGVGLGHSGTLAGDVDGNLELGLKVTTGGSLTSDKLAVLLGGDGEDLGDLVLLLGDNALNRGNDLVDNSRGSLDSDLV